MREVLAWCELRYLHCCGWVRDGLTRCWRFPQPFRALRAHPSLRCFAYPRRSSGQWGEPLKDRELRMGGGGHPKP